MQNRSHDISEVFFAFCKTVNTPFSLSCYLRFKYSQESLLELDINPTDYSDPDAFLADYQCLSFLRKFKGLSTGIDLESVALDSFARAESNCLNQNRKFRMRRQQPFTADVEALIFTMRRKIALLLGAFDMNKVTKHCGWSPGATYEFTRRCAQIDKKICELPITVTRKSLRYLKSEIESDLHWSDAILGLMPEGPYSLLKSTFQEVDGCRIVTVPKSAKTDRTIAIEPRGNMFLQKGVGGFLRSRLSRVGVDLDDQGVNQRLAQEAYRQGLATLDLKAASDSVSRELIYELLPLEWASYLDDLRSKFGFLPNGDRIEFEKFSSMGNGFTFELESLVFWAALSSCSEVDKGSEGTIAVYGDDLICDASTAPLVIHLLSELGFEINSEKSFVSGPFYESCGRHYFKSIEVTPLFQKEVVDSVPEWIRFLNRIYRKYKSSYGVSRRAYYNSWSQSRRECPIPVHLFFIPYGTEGDDGFVLDYLDFDWSTPYDRNRGFRCPVVSQKVRRLPANPRALLAWSLRRGVVTSSPFGDDVTLPPLKGKGSVRVGRAYRWVNPQREFLQE